MPWMLCAAANADQQQVAQNCMLCASAAAGCHSSIQLLTGLGLGGGDGGREGGGGGGGEGEGLCTAAAVEHRHAQASAGCASILWHFKDILHSTVYRETSSTTGQNQVLLIELPALLTTLDISWPAAAYWWWWWGRGW
jgi:hypothetical protein